MYKDINVKNGVVHSYSIYSMQASTTEIEVVYIIILLIQNHIAFKTHDSRHNIQLYKQIYFLYDYTTLKAHIVLYIIIINA